MFVPLKRLWKIQVVERNNPSL